MKLDFLMDNAEQAQMWRFVAQAVAIRDNMVSPAEFFQHSSRGEDDQPVHTNPSKCDLRQ